MKDNDESSVFAAAKNVVGLFDASKAEELDDEVRRLVGDATGNDVDASVLGGMMAMAARTARDTPSEMKGNDTDPHRQGASPSLPQTEIQWIEHPDTTVVGCHVICSDPAATVDLADNGFRIIAGEDADHLDPIDEFVETPFTPVEVTRENPDSAIYTAIVRAAPALGEETEDGVD